ncbi:SusE domain-containing protein [Bacteroides xylanisolvens]|uniref:SusE domain-containing protein n=1 Tax=Bacteroides xylanisolvens TaxID=371601 RepID=UPI0023079EF8|nr:SusE domain-containing protein [Bacteroides xylanisolvens]MDB0714462.1 SusE domain-containing protein [Bacteroides xylanisolvens]MDB0736787.1 SusE domain-containing protein [Bacteroides xylanisolvens]
MKIAKYISAICLSLLIFSACDSDLDKVYYNESEATPAVLSGIADTYVLDANKAQTTAIEFKWTNPQAGYAAQITNSLQMDLKGKNFGNAITLYSSTEEGPYNITTQDLNSKIMKLFQSYEMEVTVEPYDFEFRIASSISDAADSFYSNVESAQITPFIGDPEYPKVYLPGAYCSWGDPNDSFKQCQLLFSVNDDGIYEGWVVFGNQAKDGWKISPEASWNTSWGTDDATQKNPASITLATGTGNITCYDKYSYKFSFNKTTLELSTKASADAWGIAGTHNDWGKAAADTPMTLAFESDAAGNRAYYLTATLDLKADNAWKIRADNEWTHSFGTNDVEGEFEEAGSDNNFKVSEDGTYTIKLYFNRVKAKLIVTKK